MRLPVLPASPPIAALDIADLSQAERSAVAAGPGCGLVKLGLEYFCAPTPAGVALILHQTFLDRKLHAIPATAAGARAVMRRQALDAGANHLLFFRLFFRPRDPAALRVSLAVAA